MAEDEDKVSEYPKYVDHPTTKDARGWPLRVVVKDKAAEEALSGESEDEAPKGKPPKGGWPVK